MINYLKECGLVLFGIFRLFSPMYLSMAVTMIFVYYLSPVTVPFSLSDCLLIPLIICLPLSAIIYNRFGA